MTDPVERVPHGALVRVPLEFGEVDDAAAGTVRGDDPAVVGIERFVHRLAVGIQVLDVDQAGGQERQRVLQLLVVLGQQRPAGGHRADRHADVHRGEREERMPRRVPGEDDDRTFGRHVLSKEPGGDRVDAGPGLSEA